MNEEEKNEGKGLAGGTADAIRKIKRIKAIMPIISSCAPFLLIVFLVVLIVVVAFAPIIASYDFTGGVFNSSTSYNEGSPFSMNLGGFETADVKIFQDIQDGNIAYLSDSTMLKIKEDPSEKLDLSLLMSTIHSQNLINFNDEGDVYKEDTSNSDSDDDEINKVIEKIRNFKTLDDFNEYISSYDIPSKPQSGSDEVYNNDSIIDNSQNKDFYNSFKDKGGNVLYIYPGTRKLLGYMVGNKISYYPVTYEEWICGYDEKGKPIICNNSSSIFSDWNLLAKITSENGTNNNGGNGICYTAINNMSSAINDTKKRIELIKSGSLNNSLVANFYIDVLGIEKIEDVDFEWEKRNLEYDLSQFKMDVLYDAEYDGEIDERIKELAGGDNVRIYNGGGFVVGQDYVAVSVKKTVDYDLYENYSEDVLLKYMYVDCDNCDMKDASDDLKAKRVSELYDNLYNVKELFDYFNDGNVVNSSNSGGWNGSIIGGGGGTYNVGVSYDCSNVNNKQHWATYPGHGGNDVNGVPEGTDIYPLFGGKVTKIQYGNEHCNPVCVKVDGECAYSCSHCSASAGYGYGNRIEITGTAANGKTYTAYYAHLQSINVNLGDIVTENDIIGKLGNTGCSTGAHTHVEFHADGNKILPDTIYTTNAIASIVCSR